MKPFTPWNQPVYLICDKLLYNTTSQNIPIEDHLCQQFSVYVGMGKRRSAAVVSYMKISIWGWHYSGTNLPFNLKIRRCCLYGYPERLNETITLSHILMLYSKKPSVAGRVKLESLVLRTLKFKHVLLQKCPLHSYNEFQNINTNM